ncbi:hypothetical protein QOT17_008271 [Balamuthia mandrillaris]
MRTCGSMHRRKKDRLFGYLLLSYCCVVFACISASGEVSMVQQQQQQNQTEPSPMGKVFGPKEPIEVDHPGVLAAAQFATKKISEAYAEVLSSPAYHDVNLDQPWFSLHKVLKAETKKAQGVKLFMDMVLYNPLALIPDLETRLTKTAQEAKNQETESITQGEQETEGDKQVKAVNKKDLGGFSKWQSEQYLYITDWSKRLELQQQQNLPEVRRKQLMGYLMGLHPTKMSKHLKGGNRIPGLMPELHRVIVYVDVKKQMDVEFHMLVEKEHDGGLSLEQKELLWLEILQHHQHHTQKEGYEEEGVSADLASTPSTPSDVVL